VQKVTPVMICVTVSNESLSSLLFEPVTASCGHTFCRECLNRVLDHAPTCPACRAYLVEVCMYSQSAGIVTHYLFIPPSLQQASRSYDTELVRTLQCTNYPNVWNQLGHQCCNRRTTRTALQIADRQKKSTKSTGQTRNARVSFM